MSAKEEKNIDEILPLSNRQSMLLLFGGWTIFGLFFTIQSFISNAYFGRYVSFERTLFPWLSIAYVWALLTPFVIKAAHRFPLEKKKLPTRIGIHFFVSIIISLLQLAVYTFVREWVMGDSPMSFLPSKAFDLLVAEFHFNILLYWILIGLYQAYIYYYRFRQHEKRSAQLEIEAAHLETSLAQSHLQVLKMQLQPHFLFNTLNTISGLVHEDARAADRMIARLSSLLRTSLDKIGVQEVPLKEEIDFLKKYLDIEQIRYGDRLNVQFSTPAETLDALVPYMVLQPLVENSVRYAVAPRLEGGRISIEAERIGESLYLKVCDNGQNIKDGEKPNIYERVGLSNTRARLNQLYGNDQQFHYEISATGEMAVALKIPFVISTNER